MHIGSGAAFGSEDTIPGKTDSFHVLCRRAVSHEKGYLSFIGISLVWSVFKVPRFVNESRREPDAALTHTKWPTRAAEDVASGVDEDSLACSVGVIGNPALDTVRCRCWWGGHEGNRQVGAIKPRQYQGGVEGLFVEVHDG